MDEGIWTFSPYNEGAYKKSKNRVMFVGADPNATKTFKNSYGKIVKVNDMGEWFRGESNQGSWEGYKNQFYQRTVKMLKGVLVDIEDNVGDDNKHEDRLQHMRFIDLKATPGGPKAKTDEVKLYLETNDNAKKVSKYFTDLKYFPHFVILLGGHVHKLFFEFWKNKNLDFYDETKFVCMPHPSHSVHYEILEKVAREDLKSKFKPLKGSDFLWKWHYKADINKETGEIIRNESYWSKISK